MNTVTLTDLVRFIGKWVSFRWPENVGDNNLHRGTIKAITKAEGNAVEALLTGIERQSLGGSAVTWSPCGPDETKLTLCLGSMEMKTPSDGTIFVNKEGSRPSCWFELQKL